MNKSWFFEPQRTMKIAAKCPLKIKGLWLFSKEGMTPAAFGVKRKGQFFVYRFIGDVNQATAGGRSAPGAVSLLRERGSALRGGCSRV